LIENFSVLSLTENTTRQNEVRPRTGKAYFVHLASEASHDGKAMVELNFTVSPGKHLRFCVSKKLTKQKRENSMGFPSCFLFFYL
jgi:hypothetical protein